MDSMMKTLCGHDTDTLHGQHDAFGFAFDEAHRAMMRYCMTMVPLLTIVGKFPWPFGGWIETGGIIEALVRILHPDGRKFDRMVLALNAEAGRLIEACRSDELLAQRSDVLATVLKSRNENDVPRTHVIYEPMLRDMLMNFVLAGRDTTACTMSWMFFVLTTQPDVQAKLIEEVDAVLGGNRDRLSDFHRCVWHVHHNARAQSAVLLDRAAEEPTPLNTSARHMPYLNGVVYEALRLYPPVPMYALRCDTTP